MRVLRSISPVLALVGLVALVVFFVWRARTADAAYGPLVAFCPGPDYYGYTCEPGTGYTYLPGTADSLLYEDDGLVTLPLPFPFTFYGAEYTELHASSNGNIQFTTRNAAYSNQCLNDGPIPGMGDMIAPFWDDLDLTLYGYLQYRTEGTTPNRVFVIEWFDIPPYDNPDDRFTFSAQLFEGSSDIVFWYQDVTAMTGHNGRSATIGLQSERLGMALQYSCNQAAVADATALRFVHPEQPNTAVEPAVSFVLADPVAAETKGDLALLLETVNRQGAAGLPALNRRWLNETAPRHSQWFWGDMTGDGRDELIWLWRGRAGQPHLTGLAALGYNGGGVMAPLLYERLASRENGWSGVQLKEVGDVTADGRPDLILHDEALGALWLVTAVADEPTLLPLDLECRGGVRALDGRLVLSGCGDKERQLYEWDGQQFQRMP